MSDYEREQEFDHDLHEITGGDSFLFGDVLPELRRAVESGDRRETAEQLVQMLRQLGPGALSAPDADDPYQVFTDAKARDELLVMGRGMTEYAIRENLAAIYFVDRAARLGHMPVREFWKANYPDAPLPHIGFFNPKGFVAIEDITGGALDLDELLYADKVSEGSVESVMNMRHAQVIVAEIQAEIAGEHRDKPIAIFDVCVHTGLTTKPMLKKLALAGLTDVRLCLMSASHNESGIEPDFVVMEDEPVGFCNPFGSSGSVAKTYAGIHSAPKPSSDSSTMAAMLRDEIRQAMREGMAPPQQA